MRQNYSIKKQPSSVLTAEKNRKSAIFIVLLINFTFTFAYIRMYSQILKTAVIYFINCFLYFYFMIL